MFYTNEIENEYRFGDNGPKYLARGPRSDFGIVDMTPPCVLLSRTLLPV